MQRGEDRAALHPLKQNPPSIAEARNEYSPNSFVDIDITGPIRPPPSAITTSATAYDPHASPSPLDRDYATGARIGHQRSLTDTWFDNCQPFLNKATSTFHQHTSKAAALPSPTKSLASFISSRGGPESTTSPSSPPKFAAGAKALQNWFNGASAPVNLGVSRHDHTDSEFESDEEDEEMMSNIFPGSSRSTKLTNSTTTTSSSPDTTITTPKQSSQPKNVNLTSSTSKFSWLLSTPKPTNPTRSTPAYHNPSDELLNLNISTSLFPHGPADPLDPSSFHALLSSAESLLTRYQTSYRHLSTSMSDIRAEQSAQTDELEEAKTRVLHFKMQLEAMAARASEQDAQMRRLVEDLEFERRARREDDEARKRSVEIVRNGQTAGFQAQDGGSPKRRNRISGSEISVDSGFESECESEAPSSVFSLRKNYMSPTSETPVSSAAASMAEENDNEQDITPKKRNSTAQAPAMMQRRSTYDRVRDGGAVSAGVSFATGSWGCGNCEGGAQSAVWGRLAREREENAGLRRRVEELEDGMQGALDVVNGPWGR
ncbi:hypothetical protein B0J11DRAFT_437099 [Dendryphion nanum]|uniref:Uncharacterized protein n=1 Tax=Dendryphion nanum TaxID=256645 RepID=A0A9P9DNJ6_9PLEO|nr:hypothetical protein B0J11DRAFT_437099 [Dendryphion nanum]